MSGLKLKKVVIGADEIDSIVRHSVAPLDQAGAQHSQSPITAEGGAVISDPTPANMAGSRRKSVIWDTISILIEATVVLYGRFVMPPERRGSTSSYSHIIIPALIVESSVNPSTDRSHDGARGDNNSARSNNNSTWGDNDRACSDATRPVYAGRADDGACFRRRQGNEASY